MKIIGIHIDLKAQSMRFEYLLKVLQDMADRGFNTVLLEYQDKFPYWGEYRCLAGEDALTLDEVKQLCAFCEAHNLEIIPMVQSAGHMYWVTRHDAFAALGEDYGVKGKGSHSLCPSKSGSIELFKDLARQVMSLHPNSRYFHIGGDEVYLRDGCEACAGKDRGKILEAYYNQALEFTVKMGYTPAMWGDMVLQSDSVRKAIPKDTVIFHWEYWYGLSSDNAKRMYADGSSWAPVNEESFAALRQLVDEGFRVVACPALRSNGDAAFLGRNVHFDNCIQAMLEARKVGAEGIMVTSWAVRLVPWPLTMLPITAVQMLAQEPETTVPEIVEQYCRDTFGTVNEELRHLPRTLADAVHEALQAVDLISSGADFMDAETGRFLSDSIALRVSKRPPMDADAVKDQYERMKLAGEAALMVLDSACPGTTAQKEYVAMWRWAAESARFFGNYGAELSDHWRDIQWIREMQGKLDGFAEIHLAQLEKYFTPFSMLDEYDTRIGVHKNLLAALADRLRNQ